MNWWDSQVVAALGGSLLTGAFLLGQGLISQSASKSARAEDRAQARFERATVAYREVSDALTAVVGAYSSMVSSSPEGDHGRAEFTPSLRSVDPTRFWDLRRAWNRALPEFGEAIVQGQFEIARWARELDYMAANGTRRVFEEDRCAGDELALYVDALTALSSLEDTAEAQQVRMADKLAQLGA